MSAGMKMFSDDPCSNAQRWVSRAVRATPRGCKLAHFSFTADPSGGCEVISRYSAPQRDKDWAATAKKAANGSPPGFREPHKVRRQKWRAHRRRSLVGLLRTTFNEWKHASSSHVRDTGMATEEVAPALQSQTPTHATDAAHPRPDSPNVNRAAQSLKRPAAWAGAPPAKGNQSHLIPEIGNGMVTVHTLKATSPELEPTLLTPATAKRQKSYSEVAANANAAGAAVHTPNGTKGTYAGSQSLTPGRTRGTCWMKREGGISTEQLQLNKLTCQPPCPKN